MSVYRRKGSPFYTYDFQFRGNRFCRGTKARTRREAEAVERQARAQLKATYKSGGVLTLDAAFGKWFLEHGQHLSAQATIKGHVDALLDGLGKSTPLHSIDDANVAAYVALRRLAGGPATVNQDLKYLRAIFYRALETWKHPVQTISWRRHRLKAPQLRVRWIEREQADDLILTIDPRFRDLLSLLFLTGCRKGELFGLTWRNVDLPNRQMRVLGKGNKWRNVYLNDDAFLLLANRPADRAGHVFESKGFEWEFSKACKAIGLEDFTPHDTRHCFSTWARQSGVSLEILQRILGHSTIAQTMRYAHVADDEVRAAMSKVPSKSPITNAQVIEK